MAKRAKGRGRTGRKIGLALAGGGPQGAIYEIGALRALDEVLEGIDFNDLHVYVGVSAGAFIAANLANGLTTAQMCRAIVKHEPGEHPFVPETFYTPATRAWLQRGATVPRLLVEALWRWSRDPGNGRLFNELRRLGQALPVGLFEGDKLREYLERIYSIKGRSDDFRTLPKRLIVVAADLDSGEAVRFGTPGMDHVPISTAVQASVALPGLYRPVEIEGRHYVDGVLLKTMHGSVALDSGAELLLCLNPLVPVDTAAAVRRGIMKRGKLLHRGLPTVLSQSLRTMIRSRLEAGLSCYAITYPRSDVLLFEPKRDDYDLFFKNVFSFYERRTVCEHAYLTTRQQLRERREVLEPVLARHGVRLRGDLLEEEEVDLWRSVGLPDGRPRGVAVLDDLDRALGRLEGLLEADTA